MTALLVLAFQGPGRSGVDRVANVLAVLGSFLVVAGAGLVISDTTGFLLAGLVESFGFGLVGMWLIAANRPSGDVRPRPLQILGIVTGAVMTIGLVVLPAIVAGVDDAGTAPVYVWLGFIGWLGIFVLYPIWGIWFGRSRASAV